MKKNQNNKTKHNYEQAVENIILKNWKTGFCLYPYKILAEVEPLKGKFMNNLMYSI